MILWLPCPSPPSLHPADLLVGHPLTLALYFMTRALYRRLPWPVINPVLIPTAVIIGLLLWLICRWISTSRGLAPHRPAGTRRGGAGPAALPAGRQIRDKLTAHPGLYPHLGAHLGLHHPGGRPPDGADPALLASIATKSITTPLAMSVSQSLGGIPAIAAAVVVVVGILGALMGYPCSS
jgi:hypothetical protein